MSITLTEDQDRAAGSIFGLQKGQASVAVVTGYAGTGKTTMIRIIYDFFNPSGEEPEENATQRKPRDVTVLAPTGKAALRVTDATGIRARTLHSWVYNPIENPLTGEVTFVKKHPELFLEKEGAVLIIDEGSMVSRDLWNDVWEIAKAKALRVVILGDPYQLPPVQTKGEAAFNLLTIDTPNRVHMEQIVRQALGNPIVRASLHIRVGEVQKGLKLLRYINAFEYEDSALQTYRQGGVIISHTNEQRHKNNNMLRKALGRNPDSLEVDEPLLVIKNEHTLPRFNGEVVRFEGFVRAPSLKDPVTAYDNFTKHSTNISYGHALIEGQNVIVSLDQIFGQPTFGVGELAIGKASRIYYSRYVNQTQHPERLPYLHANLGYGLTCHKSQGSEWNYVLVQPGKWMKFKTEDERRWLYTAVTRAKEECRYTDLA